MSEKKIKVETRRSVGVDHPINYKIAADHEFRELAEGIADTYMEVIINSIVNQPRSLQKRIGPSEMGVECRRAVLHKLNGDPEPPRGSVPWKPTIGTAVHDYLERAFTSASAKDDAQRGRWLTEERVNVGEIAGKMIDGSTDLFDTFGHAVMDHKIVGKSTLTKYRAHGPSEQYRQQAHLYGKGWADDGFQVKLVMICFLPREGELTDTFIWSEPYSEFEAQKTLNRINGLESLRLTLGIDQALSLYPDPCDDRWCKWCGSGNSFGARPMANDTASLFGIRK